MKQPSANKSPTASYNLDNCPLPEAFSPLVTYARSLQWRTRSSSVLCKVLERRLDARMLVITGTSPTDHLSNATRHTRGLSTTNSRSQRCLRDHDRDKCVLSKLVCNVGRHNSGLGRRGPQTGSPCGPARFLRISISREVSKLRLATTGQCRPCLSRGPERQEMVAPAM